MASALPCTAARAGKVISVILGVNLTITGVVATSLTQEVMVSNTLGSCPTAEPIPLSHIP